MTTPAFKLCRNILRRKEKKLCNDNVAEKVQVGMGGKKKKSRFKKKAFYSYEMYYKLVHVVTTEKEKKKSRHTHPTIGGI